MELPVKPLPTIGNTYTHWSVLAGPVRHTNGKTTWVCQCQCGKVKEVAQFDLVNGRTKSCGCMKSEGQAPKVVSEETKALLRARRSVQAPPNPKGGKASKRSDESRKKMSDAATKRWALIKAQKGTTI